MSRVSILLLCSSADFFEHFFLLYQSIMQSYAPCKQHNLEGWQKIMDVELFQEFLL